jgi:hypothetical protein
MHLYGTQLQRYIDRDHDRRSLNALDAHVSNCFHCLDAIAAARAETTQWERRGFLGRLVAVDTPLGTVTHPQAAEVMERAAA